jgi:hypothetical protein
MTHCALRACAIAAIVIAVAACAPDDPNVESPGPTAFELPVIPADWAREGATCAGVDVTPLVLRGQAADGGVSVTANGTWRILWPAGFTAVFDPALTVRSPDGSAFAHEGEDMTADIWHGSRVCVLGEPGGPAGALEVWIAPATR